MTCFVIIKFCICTASGSSFLCFSHPKFECVSLSLTVRESVSFCLSACVCVCKSVCLCSAFVTIFAIVPCLVVAC